MRDMMGGWRHKTTYDIMVSDGIYALARRSGAKSLPPPLCQPRGKWQVASRVESSRMPRVAHLSGSPSSTDRQTFEFHAACTIAS